MEKLGYGPLPSVRTIERIVNRAGLSCPPLQLAQKIARTEYPEPQAQDSNQVHQVDFVGPRYLKNDKTRYYFLVCKDVFDQAVYLELVTSRKSDTVLEFLVHAWQRLGIPTIVQFDNGRGLYRFQGGCGVFIAGCIGLGIAFGIGFQYIYDRGRRNWVDGISLHQRRRADQ